MGPRSLSSHKTLLRYDLALTVLLLLFTTAHLCKPVPKTLLVLAEMLTAPPPLLLLLPLVLLPPPPLLLLPLLLPLPLLLLPLLLLLLPLLPLLPLLLSTAGCASLHHRWEWQCLDSAQHEHNIYMATAVQQGYTPLQLCSKCSWLMITLSYTSCLALASANAVSHYTTCSSAWPVCFADVEPTC